MKRGSMLLHCNDSVVPLKKIHMLPSYCSELKHNTVSVLDFKICECYGQCCGAEAVHLFKSTFLAKFSI